MKQQWTTAFRLTLCAAALVGTSMVSAQTQPVPAPASPSAPAPAAAMQEQAPHHPTKKMHRPMHKSMGKHHGSGKYASPQQHEAAAVAGEHHKGVGPKNPPEAQQGNAFERNALRRCDVFKTDDDRRACVERVRQPQISGSVQGGGMIREYTQTLPVPAMPAMQNNAAPRVMQPQMAPQPMEPVRK